MICRPHLSGKCAESYEAHGLGDKESTPHAHEKGHNFVVVISCSLILRCEMAYKSTFLKPKSFDKSKLLT